MAVINPGFVDIEVQIEVGQSPTFNIAPKFPQIEMSREHGAPQSLYFFRWGSAAANYYAYTDAEEPVTWGSPAIVYQPIPIGRSKIKASGNLDQKTLKVETSINTEIAQLYLTGGPSYRTTLVIYQGHAGLTGLTDYKAVFSGRLVGLDPKGPLVEISAEPASTAMRGTGLRRHYQYGCPFVLYDPDTCKADPHAVQKSAVVSAFGKADVTIPVGWNEAIAVEKFRNGYVTWTGGAGQVEIRTIIDATATNLALSRKITNLLVSDTLTIYPGCNHQGTGQDCQNLHIELSTQQPNIVNYGGQENIPIKSPIGVTSQYY